MKVKLLHARYWKYTGNHGDGKDQIKFDPHNFGLDLISAMASVAEEKTSVKDTPLTDVVVRHHKGDSFGHQVHVAATRQQWDAVRGYLEGIGDE